MQSVLTVTLPFFAVVGCGYLAGARGLFDRAAVRSLNGFVFFFALPALLIRSLAERSWTEIVHLPFMAAYGLAGVGLFTVTALAGRAAFGGGLAQAALRGQAGSVANIGFLGLPMMIALFGPDGAVPVVLALIVDLLIVLPLSILLLEAARSDAARSLPARAAAVARGVLVNPFVLSIAAGLALSASGLGLVAPPIAAFTDFIGAAAGPCALFALGASLAAGPLSDGWPEVAALSAIKLLVHPALVWLLLTQLFAVSAELAVAGTLIAALPIAGNVFVFAERYRVSVARSATAILVSTAVAVASFSAAVAIFGV